MATKVMRLGIVSLVNGENHTARVFFPDEDNKQSYDLPVICANAQDTQMYSLPDVGEQVVCLFEQNSSGVGSKNGYILGAVYSRKDKPQESDSRVKSIRFASGSFIREDGAGNIEIHAANSIKITAPRIDLN